MVETGSSHLKYGSLQDDLTISTLAGNISTIMHSYVRYARSCMTKYGSICNDIGCVKLMADEKRG